MSPRMLAMRSRIAVSGRAGYEVVQKAVAAGYSDDSRVGDWMTRHPETIEADAALLATDLAEFIGAVMRNTTELNERGLLIEQLRRELLFRIETPIFFDEPDAIESKISNPPALRRRHLPSHVHERPLLLKPRLERVPILDRTVAQMIDDRNDPIGPTSGTTLLQRPRRCRFHAERRTPTRCRRYRRALVRDDRECRRVWRKSGSCAPTDWPRALRGRRACIPVER